MEKASGIMESLFQRSLDDLIKGLRGVHAAGEARYVSSAVEEIRKEIKSTDGPTKAVALQKLTYLNMLHGVDMEWAAFHVVEVMSLPKFAYKRAGYLAASQSFREGIEVVLLATNQLRKDLTSTNEHEAGLALACLSCIATPDLARDLTPELFSMLSSTRTLVRKKSVLVLRRFFDQYPDTVRIAFKRLVEKMEDADPGVVCASVSLLCEMVIKEPRAHLPLAPDFHRVLVSSSASNWLLIKTLKIFGALAPIEPRLCRKIAEPVCEFMRKSSAASVHFECVRTVANGLADHPGAVDLAVEKLKELLVGDDPNLRYLCLEVLGRLMTSHPWVVAANKEVITGSLNDGDLSIQRASLRLIMGMLTEENVMETVDVLMHYAKRSDHDFCNEIIGAILETCSKGLYKLVTDFSWYVSVLGELARFPHGCHGEELERQFLDIGARVKDVRKDLVSVARGLLLDPTLLGHSSLHGVLSALAWIAGEYVELALNPYELIEALLQPRIKLLSAPVLSVYLQAVMKIFTYYSFKHLRGIECDGNEISGKGANVSLAESLSSMSLGEDAAVLSLPRPPPPPPPPPALSPGMLSGMMELIKSNAGHLVEHTDVEVQERASNLLGLLKAMEEEDGEFPQGGESMDNRSDRGRGGEWYQIITFLRSVFTEDLGPVSKLAQGRVPIPDGLVLLDSLDSLRSVNGTENGNPSILGDSHSREWEDEEAFRPKNKENVTKATDSALLLKEHRQRHGTYYLLAEKGEAKLDEYPPPRISNQRAQDSEDVVKLAEQSLFSTKTRRSKPRPVVVRLDDSDEFPSPLRDSATKDRKEGILSTAIRDVLTGGDKGKMPYKHKRKGHQSESKSRTAGSSLQGGVGTSDGHNSVKEKEQIGTSVTNTDSKEEEKLKHPSRHRRHMHSQRRKHRSPVQLLSPQVPVIPDFLL